MTRFSITQLILGISVFILIAGSAYFLFGNASFFQITPNGHAITIARTGGFPTSLFWIAEDNGYFRDEGLQVSYLDYDAGQPGLDALREGRADITASGELPIVRSIMRGDKIFIVAELESDNGKNIIGRKDRGIRSAADFKGKRIGVTKGTVNEFQLISFLEAHGIAENQVTLVDVSFAKAAEELMSDRLDAVSARQGTIVQLEQQLADNGTVFSTEGIYTFRFLMVANQDFIKNQPDAIEKVLRALVRAEEFTRKQPEASQRLISKYLQLEPSVIEDTWGRYRFSINLSQPIFVTLEDEARWLINRDQTLPREVPNFLEYIYIDALNKVKPGSVTIPR
ncbi:MAG TPA: NrtA/SsuA/CpmA family ABC transporter substrate-binding protein [Candidatus Paceibacterota bacterium]|nr:NrtA/SsuA/CpmA family ABC transporter substrate-binding protein [Candidatus Paceibacterota bacterium]